MSKFKKKKLTSQEIPTSALPDIIFMLLFFFMVATKMRENEVLVKNDLPEFTQSQKIDKKMKIAYIYIGPAKGASDSDPAKIQVNDKFIQPNQIGTFVSRERDKLGDSDQDKLTISLKVHKDAQEGVVNDVETQLRKVNARRVIYSAVLADS